MICTSLKYDDLMPDTVPLAIKYMVLTCYFVLIIDDYAMYRVIALREVTD
jgi:hypothetical protein